MSPRPVQTIDITLKYIFWENTFTNKLSVQPDQCWLCELIFGFLSGSPVPINEEPYQRGLRGHVAERLRWYGYKARAKKPSLEKANEQLKVTKQ